MIITRAPFRISLFGGGTDLPEWYRYNEGAVISASIDKYCYITCRYKPAFFPYKYRLVYNETENANTLDEIKHPVIREALRCFGIDDGVEIHHDADLPARSGIGSSSTFAVGLVKALAALKEMPLDNWRITQHAIHIERDCVGDCVGDQDQTAAAYGGFNRIKFSARGMQVFPYAGNHTELQSYLALFYLGQSRLSSELQRTVVSNLVDNTSNLRAIQESVTLADKLIARNAYGELGTLMDAMWKLKRQLAAGVSTDYIDDLYNIGIEAGAWGGKLLGAGGGGFMLFVAHPIKHHMLKASMAHAGAIHVPFKFEKANVPHGAQVLYAD